MRGLVESIETFRLLGHEIIYSDGRRRSQSTTKKRWLAYFGIDAEYVFQCWSLFFEYFVLPFSF